MEEVDKSIFTYIFLFFPNLILDTHALVVFLPFDIVYETGIVGTKLKTVSYPCKVHMNLT